MNRPLQCTSPLSISIALIGHFRANAMSCSFASPYSMYQQAISIRDTRTQEATTVTISRADTSASVLQSTIGSTSTPRLRRRINHLLRAFVRETQAQVINSLASRAA